MRSVILFTFSLLIEYHSAFTVPLISYIGCAYTLYLQLSLEHSKIWFLVCQWEDSINPAVLLLFSLCDTLSVIGNYLWPHQ